MEDIAKTAAIVFSVIPSGVEESLAISLAPRSTDIQRCLDFARHDKSLEMDGCCGCTSPTLCGAQITAQTRASTTNRPARSSGLLSQGRKTSTNFLPGLLYSVAPGRLRYPFPKCFTGCCAKKAAHLWRQGCGFVLLGKQTEHNIL